MRWRRADECSGCRAHTSSIAAGPSDSEAYDAVRHQAVQDLAPLGGVAIGVLGVHRRAFCGERAGAEPRFPVRSVPRVPWWRGGAVCRPAPASAPLDPSRRLAVPRRMPKLIEQPTIIEAAGNVPKRIEEFAGRVNSGHTHVSVARMVSPAAGSSPASVRSSRS